jgi:hypothetical protein
MTYNLTAGLFLAAEGPPLLNYITLCYSWSMIIYTCKYYPTIFKICAILVAIIGCVVLGAIIVQYTHDGLDESDTTDWKLYTNISCGYSFKYPNHWNIREVIASTSTCNRVYLISPNNPRMFDVVGRSEYSFTISRLDSFYPQFELLHRNTTGNWEGIPAEVVKKPKADNLDREIYYDMFGIQNMVCGLVAQGKQVYIIFLPPVDGGHTNDDFSTLNGVLMSFQVL